MKVEAHFSLLDKPTQPHADDAYRKGTMPKEAWRAVPYILGSRQKVC